MTKSAVHRKKNPVMVKEAILSAACHMTVTQGLQSVTLQAVADAANITKSGLIHHFRSKQELISAIRNRALDQFLTSLETHMQRGSAGKGMFTRAYIRTCLESVKTNSELMLITILWSDPEMRTSWYQWLSAKEHAYSATDGETIYKIGRLAADGAWLAAIDGSNIEDVEPVLLELIDQYR